MKNSIKSTAIIFCVIFIWLGFLWGLGNTLVPLIFSCGLAYLIFPLIKSLEQKGVSRKYSVPGLFALIAIAMILVMALILPALVEEGQVFLRELPTSAAKAIGKIELFLESVGHPLSLSSDSVGLYLKEHVSEISGGLLKNLSLGIKSSFTGIARWLIAILNIFLIPVFFFYVMNDYEKLSNELKSFIPRSFRPKLAHYLELSNTVLSGYIRGQLMVALCSGVLYAIGLFLVGLKFGVLIGLFSGIISIIPYAGFTIGFAIAIVIGLANYSGGVPVFGIVVVFVIVQALEGFFITPKLVGNRVGLSSFATMLALIIGGNIFGLIGMLLAIPVAAIVKSIFGELKQEYQGLDFYRSQ